MALLRHRLPDRDRLRSLSRGQAGRTGPSRPQDRAATQGRRLPLSGGHCTRTSRHGAPPPLAGKEKRPPAQGHRAGRGVHARADRTGRRRLPVGPMERSQTRLSGGGRARGAALARRDTRVVGGYRDTPLHAGTLRAGDDRVASGTFCGDRQGFGKTPETQPTRQPGCALPDPARPPAG